MNINQQELENLKLDLVGKTALERLRFLATKYPGEVAFSTSFGLEDQVVLHLIATENLPIRVFTLDTGRLFPETYSLWSRNLEKYPVTIQTFYPNQEKLEELLGEKGPNSFYTSVPNREACCAIRKLEPLGRALQNVGIWVTGIRAEQSPNRGEFEQMEWDNRFQLIKFHPLLNWSTTELKQFVADNNIPYNGLHDKGFPSIGCAPCTRAVLPGQDERSGRWWWEDSTKKECGLHVN